MLAVQLKTIVHTFLEYYNILKLLGVDFYFALVNYFLEHCQGWSEKTQPEKTRPKKPDKTHLKKPTKNGFFRVLLGFFKFWTKMAQDDSQIVPNDSQTVP